MRPSIKDLVALAAASLPVGEPIYEFGAVQVAGQEGFADLRPLFPGRRYVGADLRPGLGVDVLLDLHTLDLPKESVGTALCLDTLEHVEDPRRALAEIHRVLGPQGWVLISSVMNFPIHDYPDDYWRFTPSAFQSILKPFPSVKVGFAGPAAFPHTVVGVGKKGESPDWSAFEAGLAAWKARHAGPASGGILGRAARRLAPPLLLDFAASLRRSRRRPS